MISENVKLSEREVRELKGLQAREREIQREFIQPLSKDLNDFLKQVQDEHGVELGRTHDLNLDNFELVALKSGTEDGKDEKKEK